MSDRLIDRWVSGNASAEDRAELAELLEQDPQLVDRLFRAAERECELAELFRGQAPIALPSAAPVRATRSRRPARQAWWLPFASGLAAALLFGVLVLQLGSPRRGDAPPALAEKAPAQPAPAAKAPPQPAAGNAEPGNAGPGNAETVAAAPVEVPLPPGLADERTTLARFFADLPSETPEATLAVPAQAKPATVASAGPASEKGGVALAKREKPGADATRMDRLDGELKDADGGLVMRYSLRAPHLLPGRPELGLVLCFHGAGGNEQWLADPILSALRSQGEVPMVVAALKSKGVGWTTADEGSVLAFIDWAKRTYPIDPRRIVIQGVSSGGWMVNHFGSRHGDLIAGAVVLCGGNGFEAPAKRPGNAAETGFEYYVVHGTADEDVPVRNARAVTATLRGNGFRFVYREFPGVGHDVFSDEDTRRDFAGWMTRLRHKSMPLAEEDRKALAGFANRDEAERLLLSDEGARTLVRIGGLPAEKILVRALRAKNPQARATAARLFAQTSNLPGASTLIAGLLDDKDAGVRHAAVATLARTADWNDQDALIALCRFAGAKASSAGERLDVVRALTGSIAFRCTPGPENQLIHELLVHLLDDEDVSLRAAAIAALPRVEPERYGYDPTAAAGERREAVRQWRRRYLELFAPTDEKPEPRK